LPLAVEPLFHLPVTTGWSVGIALAALVVAALVNAAGIDILGKLTVLGVAAEVFILVVLSTLVLIFGSHQSPSILLNGAPFTQFSGWLPAFLGGGIFVSLWVLYAFENAGLLGEETKDAPRIAPRAVLLALLGTFLMGVYFLFAFVISIPNVQAIEGSATPVQDIISHALPGVFVVIYLALIAGVTLLGANAYFTAVSRQVYGMARSGLLPFSTFLARTRKGTPYAAILIVAAVSALPLARTALKCSGVPVATISPPASPASGWTARPPETRPVRAAVVCRCGAWCCRRAGRRTWSGHRRRQPGGRGQSG